MHFDMMHNMYNDQLQLILCCMRARCAHATWYMYVCICGPLAELIRFMSNKYEY